ncbi:hypothetical protein [Escherichia albertii]|uniref:hypothetical protein n=1 Tax=Escherichia albertii TaxID=208962 RepID=UPI00201DD59A|nr:hypothetical protein [Escherichia albertii]
MRPRILINFFIQTADETEIIIQTMPEAVDSLFKLPAEIVNELSQSLHLSFSNTVIAFIISIAPGLHPIADLLQFFCHIRINLPSALISNHAGDEIAHQRA